MRYDDYAIAPDLYSKLGELTSQAQDQTLDPAQRAQNQAQQNTEIGKMLQSAMNSVAVPKQQSALVKSVNTSNIHDITKNVELIDNTRQMPAEAELAHSDAVHRLNVMANHVESVVDYVSHLGADPPSTQSPWRQ